MSSDPHHYKKNNSRNPTSWWLSSQGFIAAIFIAIIGFYLITEHAAHLMGILPWLLILACPLMHLFMHHGHNHGSHNKDTDSTEK